MRVRLAKTWRACSDLGLAALILAEIRPSSSLVSSGYSSGICFGIDDTVGPGTFGELSTCRSGTSADFLISLALVMARSMGGKPTGFECNSGRDCIGCSAAPPSIIGLCCSSRFGDCSITSVGQLSSTEAVSRVGM